MRFTLRRPSDAAPDGAARSARDPGSRRPKRRLFPLSIRASLVIIVLIPVAVAVGLTSSVVAQQVSRRDQAVDVRQSSLVLDALLRARIDVNGEYVPSAAIVAARENHLTEEQLDSLLGVDFKKNLVQARRLVDQQAAFGPHGVFAVDHRALLSLRHSVDDGTASPSQVEAFFDALGTKVDATWLRTFNAVQSTRTSVSQSTSERLTALDASFDALTSGLGEESLQRNGSLETVLVDGRHAGGHPEPHHQPPAIPGGDGQLPSSTRTEEHRGVVGPERTTRSRPHSRVTCNSASRPA